MTYDRTKMVDENKIDSVMSLWDMGFDTLRIAKVLQEQQHDIERWLHIGLNRRKKDRDDAII